MTEQGVTYAKFIEAELKAEHERRSAVDARAQTIATSSGAFLALVFTLTAVATGKDYKFSEWGARGVLLALLLFVGAAVLGLVASNSRKYEVGKDRTLQRMLNEQWGDSEVDARNITAGLNVTTITSLRNGTSSKAKKTFVAIWGQAAAVVILIASIGWELRNLIIWW